VLGFVGSGCVWGVGGGGGVWGGEGGEGGGGGWVGNWDKDVPLRLLLSVPIVRSFFLINLSHIEVTTFQQISASFQRRP